MAIKELFKYMKRNFNFGRSELESAIAIRKTIYYHLIVMNIGNLLFKLNMRKSCKNLKKTK